MRLKSGFSLIELMTALVIGGVLVVVAVPSYRQYVLRSKYAEAYQNLGVMVQQQKVYFNENRQFYTLETNGVNPYDMNPVCNSSMFKIRQFESWDKVGYPVPIGARTWFGYTVMAGKFNNAGVDQGIGSQTPANGLMLSNMPPPMTRISYTASDEKACGGLFMSNEDYGVNTNPGGLYDYAIIYANGILEPGTSTECHWIATRVQSIQNGPPSSPTGFIEFKDHTAAFAGSDCLTTQPGGSSSGSSDSGDSGDSGEDSKEEGSDTSDSKEEGSDSRDGR